MRLSALRVNDVSFILFFCCALLLVLLTSFSHRTFATDESFSVKLQLLAPISISASQELAFGSITSGLDNDVLVQPGSSNAATFSATGEPNHGATGSVVENSIQVFTGEGSDTSERITVDSFTLGGDMDAGGSIVFNSEGQVNNLSIGGTAHVEADDIVGAYNGIATFRVVYN